jgi:hypothetical protein
LIRNDPYKTFPISWILIDEKGFTLYFRKNKWVHAPAHATKRDVATKQHLSLCAKFVLKSKTNYNDKNLTQAA